MIREDSGMTIIVKTVTRFTLGFILVYGIYVALNGHAAPGGGFAGGVIIALSFVHIMLAFGRDAALKRLKPNGLRFMISMAGLIFLYVLVTNFAGGCVPFNLLLGGRMRCDIFNNEFIIPFCEAVIVGCGLFVIFIALVLLSKGHRHSE